MFSNYKCDQCGACCGLIVEPEYADAMREPRIFELHKLSVAKRGEDLDDALSDWRSGCGGMTLLDPATRRCPFAKSIDEDSRQRVDCQIYATRPNQCVRVEAGDAKCQQARESHGLQPLRDQDGLLATLEDMQQSCYEYDMGENVPYGEEIWPQ